MFCGEAGQGVQAVGHEAVDIAMKEGLSVNLVHLNEIWPFPVEATSQALQGAKRIITVENNATAQLAHLLRAETGYQVIDRILKFDGRPFSPAHILKELEGARW
jgi:2-oxoglutarate ferredoxin oxidoreductase subunit alpha